MSRDSVRREGGEPRRCQAVGRRAGTGRYAAGMTSAARRQFSVLIAAVAVLVGAAGFAPAGAVAPLAGPATVAVSAGGPGLQAAGLLDTRVQRSGATEERDPSSRPHGYAAPAGPGRCP